MKRITVALLGVFLAANSFGQFFSGPFTDSQVGVSTVIAIAGSSTSNLTTTLQKNISIGPQGVGLFAYVAGTNAATTTNAIIRYECTVDGTHWIDGLVPAFAVAQNGTAGYSLYTNILPTSVNIGNLKQMRIKSIQNTNLATIFFTNLTYTTR